MKSYKIGLIISGIVFGLFGILLLINLSAKPRELNVIILLGTITLISFLFVFSLLIKFLKTNTPEKLAKYKHAQVYGTLVDGLPIPAQVQVVTRLFSERVELEAFTGANHQKFNLDLEKIQRVSILNEKQIKQIVTQSAPGMIIGAAAFGLLGAMVGGRVKTKNQIKINSLLLIDYISDEENKQILINVSENTPQAADFVSKFHGLKPLVSNQPIQL